jgi:hypothetical protein
VGITAVTLDTTTNKFGGGPITVGGNTGTNVENMSAGVFIDATTGIVTIHCNTTSATVAVGDPLCG